ncbi:hypothetical protein [uncultured Roseobacter sp.]|uniref:hypothetical protein n=1 Tax=uncultured Roseobacter sp. TaxID=114847 RepID=UPI00262A28C4|nr:hypothetical protein [uncultured Roseobacter sp.]
MGDFSASRGAAQRKSASPFLLVFIPAQLVFEVALKAMPVILTSQDEIQTWMMAPTAEAPALQRPLPDHALTTVAYDMGGASGYWLEANANKKDARYCVYHAECLAREVR